MHDCVLKAFDAPGSQALEEPIELPVRPDRTYLDRIYRTHLQAFPCHHAVAVRDGRILAVYLAEKHVPRDSIRTAVRRRAPGRWAVTAVRLSGDNGLRALAGPELFFRQADVGGDDAWLATVMMRFAQTVTVRELSFHDAKVWAWELADQRYFYLSRGWRWWLYGAGNTPKERMEDAIARERPDRAEAFLWAVGAIKLE